MLRSLRSSAGFLPITGWMTCIPHPSPLLVSKKNFFCFDWRRAINNEPINNIKRRIISGFLRRSGRSEFLMPDHTLFHQVISSCLPLLHSCRAGSMLYMLDCLCPGDFSITDIAHIDLSKPHYHRQRSPAEFRLMPTSEEFLLVKIKIHVNSIRPTDYPDFWVELTRKSLLTCPVDPKYYQEDKQGKELFCQRLRSELIDRIFKID